LKVGIKKLLTHAVRTIVIAGSLIFFTHDSYAVRLLAIVEASVCPSLCHTAVFCQNDTG